MPESSPEIALSESLVFFEKSSSLRSLRDRIDRLEISADAKSLLLDLATITLNVGGKLLALGRKILEFALDLAQKFKNVIFGVIIALLLSAVLGAIPLLGPAIAALLTPLMVAFGILRGSIEDFRGMAIQSEIDALKQRMEVLSTYAVA